MALSNVKKEQINKTIVNPHGSKNGDLYLILALDQIILCVLHEMVHECK